MQQSIEIWMRRLVLLLVLAGALASPRQILIAHDGVAERIEQLSALIVEHPDNAALLAERGELYRSGHQWARALADLNRAVDLDPTLAAADLGRAHVFLEQGDLRASAAAASRVLARQPGQRDALVVRARARARLGLARDAAADFTRALDERPLPDLYIERARLVAGSNLAGIDEALGGLDEGIARLGPIVTLELPAIDLEVRRHRYDAALARLDRVSVQAARKESWLARRGAILEQAGRLDEARTAYRSALDATERLPDRIRRTRASLTLIEQLRADLARLRPSRVSD